MPFFFSFLKKSLEDISPFRRASDILYLKLRWVCRDFKLRADPLTCSMDSVESLPLSAKPAELLAHSLATDPRGRWDFSSGPFVSLSSAFTHSTTRTSKNYNIWRFIFSTGFLFPVPLISISGSVDFYFRFRWFLFPDPLISISESVDFYFRIRWEEKYVKIIRFSIQKISALQKSCKFMKYVTYTHKRHNSLGDVEMNSPEKSIRFAVIWFVERVLSGRQIFV